MIRRQVTLSAMRGLCTKLGSLREGRKSLILVSEGYNATLPPQMRSNLPGGFAGTTGDARRAIRSPATTTSMEDRAQFSAGMDMQREMQDVCDACNRNNTAIYAVDPRGLAVGELRHHREHLDAHQPAVPERLDRHAARAGRQHRRPRHRESQRSRPAAMKQIIRDASAYYLVGYNSTQAPTDGKFHEIKVRVKRPGRAGPRAQGLLGLHGGGRRSARSPGPSPARRPRSPRRWRRWRR